MVDSGIAPNDAVKILSDKLKLWTVRRTLLNYEREGLMPRAWRSENGREAYYTLEGLSEFYASWKFLHGDFITILPGFSSDDKLRLTPKFVAYVRHMAHEIKYSIFEGTPIGEAFEIFQMMGFDVDEVNPSNFQLLYGFARVWLNYRDTALTMLGQ